MNLLVVGLEPLHAEFRKSKTRIRQKIDRVAKVMNDDWFADIELQIATAPRNADGRVIAVDLNGDHNHRFALRGIHLARHDRATRFVFR